MVEKKKAAILGGDIRQFYLAAALKEEGFRVYGYGVMLPEKEGDIVETDSALEAIQKCDVVILPIPVTGDGKTLKSYQDDETILLEEVEKGLKKEQKVFGGMMPERLKKVCSSKGIPYYDFMEMDAVAIKNAIATAEGAIVEAILGSPSNMHGSKSLIIGFGRCGQVLADKVKGMGSEVTIMARRRDALAKAEACGYKGMPMFDSKSTKGMAGNGKYFCDRQEDLCGFHYVFNTVPTLVVTEKMLQQLSKEAMIIDIASKPGGVDFKACENMKISFKHVLGLPGKYSPKSSGYILKDAILENL